LTDTVHEVGEGGTVLGGSGGVELEALVEGRGLSLKGRGASGVVIIIHRRGRGATAGVLVGIVAGGRPSELTSLVAGPRPRVRNLILAIVEIRRLSNRESELRRGRKGERERRPTRSHVL
jgi:hypothetical protein